MKLAGGDSNWDEVLVQSFAGLECGWLHSCAKLTCEIAAAAAAATAAAAKTSAPQRHGNKKNTGFLRKLGKRNNFEKHRKHR